MPGGGHLVSTRFTATAPHYDEIVPYSRVDDPEKLRRLLAAVLMITADVELPDLLRHLVEEACQLVAARYGALGVLTRNGVGLEQFLTVGLSESDELAIGPRPTGRGVLGLVINSPEPLRLDRLAEHPDSYGFPANHPPMTSFLGVPVRVREDVYGNLYLADKMGADRFSDEDEALTEALALAAGIAIENTRLHDRVQVLSVLDDRERIARDLHDRVIQRIFAVGMGLQGAVRLPDPEQVAARVSKAVDDLDLTINEIRTAIFELGDSTLPGGLREAVLRLVDDIAPTLAGRPEVTFRGLVDTTVPDSVAEHVLAVVREALTNAGKHAEAHRYRVEITANDVLTVEVTDDGKGFAGANEDATGLGLTNLRNRAQKLGGNFEVQPGMDGLGTRLVWSAPI